MSSFIDKVKSIFTGKKKEELKPLLGVVHPAVKAPCGDDCKCASPNDEYEPVEVKAEIVVPEKPASVEVVAAPKKPAAKKPAAKPAATAPAKTTPAKPAANKPAAKKPAGPKGSKNA